MGHIIVTNNKYVGNIAAFVQDIRIIFIDKNVKYIIDYCSKKMLEGGIILAADPMGGRRFRPFPYLTIILEESYKSAEPNDWDMIVEYEVLDASRKREYEEYSESLKKDFRIIDYSLTMTAIEKFSDIHFLAKQLCEG